MTQKLAIAVLPEKPARKIDLDEDARAGRQVALHVWASMAGMELLQRATLLDWMIESATTNRELLLALLARLTHAWHVDDQAAEMRLDAWFDRQGIHTRWDRLFQVAYVSGGMLALLSEQGPLPKGW